MLQNVIITGSGTPVVGGLPSRPVPGYGALCRFLKILDLSGHRCPCGPGVPVPDRCLGEKQNKKGVHLPLQCLRLHLRILAVQHESETKGKAVGNVGTEKQWSKD